ncbi:MAG: hypothetical protein WD712_01935 [Candidatus Spechtbacterales bacterium]
MLKHPWDYFLHFSVSFIGFFIFYIAARKIFSLPPVTAAVAAVGAIFLLGLFKEFYIDVYVGKTDMVYDIVANTIGILVALLVKTKLLDA